jgi:hypothetical protein
VEKAPEPEPEIELITLRTVEELVAGESAPIVTPTTAAAFSHVPDAGDGVP